MQYRRPVGSGPSSNTWPRWASHRLHNTSVLTTARLSSVRWRRFPLPRVHKSLAIRCLSRTWSRNRTAAGRSRRKRRVLYGVRSSIAAKWWLGALMPRDFINIGRQIGAPLLIGLGYLLAHVHPRSTTLYTVEVYPNSRVKSQKLKTISRAGVTLRSPGALIVVGSLWARPIIDRPIRERVQFSGI